MGVTTIQPSVVWHDLECGTYRADLPLWRELAGAVAGPVLDIGAGTGRVALELARDGVEIVAMDVDPVLLGECARRAGGLPVRTVAADARRFQWPGPPFALVLVPMQTVQLLDAAGRSAMLTAVHRCTAPGGLLACALVDELQPFDESAHILPTPDERRVDDVLYSSQPTAVRELPDRAILERRRVISATDERSEQLDVIELYRVTARELERAARDCGWTPARPRLVPPTLEHVGATVVMLRA